MQVAIYDMGSNPLSDKLQREVEQAVQKIIQDSGTKETLAYTVVNE
jgi:hypothetical protein